jgi:hypothetical protein
MKPTQKQKILKVLEDLRDGVCEVPGQFIRRHPDGDGISTRYFKQVMLVSEANGRISELRNELRKIGLDIESSTEKDAYGFAYQRLTSLAPTQLTL